MNIPVPQNSPIPQNKKYRNSKPRQNHLIRVTMNISMMLIMTVV
jgi:hypothetical protein